MRKRFAVVFCLVIPSVIGCSSSNYLIEKPMILYPQGILVQTDAEIQSRSMKTLLDAFSANNWEIRRVDSDSGVIAAEACQRREHCAEVQATVQKDGSVEILRTPGQKLSENEEVQLKRWLGRVKKTYERQMKATP